MAKKETINKLMKSHLEYIAECNSKELLEYSQKINRQRNNFIGFPIDAIFEAIDKQRELLNSNLGEKVECERKLAINEYLEKKKCKV